VSEHPGEVFLPFTLQALSLHLVAEPDDTP